MTSASLAILTMVMMVMMVLMMVVVVMMMVVVEMVVEVVETVVVSSRLELRFVPATCATGRDKCSK